MKKQATEEAQRIPPQNVEAEVSVLGAVLCDGRSLDKIADYLDPDDFYRPSHRSIYQAMRELHQASEAIDLVTLKDRLQRAGRLEEVGGAAYLASLVDAVPTAANISYHARIVREKSILRQLIQTATEIVGMGFQPEEEVDILLDLAEKKILEIGHRKTRKGFRALSEVIKDTFERIQELYERKELVSGVPTGFKDFDHLTSGLQPGDLVIIAGRPSMGKTSFVLNIAEHVAMNAGLPVAIFSLEMSQQQLVQRMLCSQARVDSQKLRTGFISKDDWPRLTIAAGRLSEAPIYIDDTPSISALEIRAMARRLKHDVGNLALIIIDYLQLMRGESGIENRQQEVSDISRSLKSLAKELNVPVVALSQLSRAPEMRGRDRRPQLSDLRESGAIEQDADLVAFIYREEVYNPEDPEARGKAEVIIRKQRNGPVDTVTLAFLHEFTKFADFYEERR